MKNRRRVSLLAGITLLAILSAPHAYADDDAAELARLRATVMRMEKAMLDMQAQIAELQKQKSVPAAASTPKAVSSAPPLADVVKAKPVPEAAGLSESKPTMRHRETLQGDNLEHFI